MLSASDIFKAIRNKIWWILAVLILVTGVMYYITSKMAKKYKSKAQFSTGITESSEITLGESKEVNQPFAIAQRFTNLVEMMRSRQCVSMVQFRLLEHELTDSVAFRQPEHLPKLSPENKKILLDRLHAKLDSGDVLTLSNKTDNDINNYIKAYNYDQDDLLNRTTMKRVPDSDFISVEVESENARLSAFLANIFVTEFIKFYDNQRSYKTAGSVNFFEKMARLKKKELDAKVNELKTFKLKNRVINLYEQTKSIVNQLSSVEIMREQENMKISSRERAADEIGEKFTSKDKKYYEVVSLKINNEIEDLKLKINKLNEKYLSSNMMDKSAKDSVDLLHKEMTVLIEKASDEAIVNPNEVKKELISRKLHSELEVEIALKTVASIDKDIERLQGIISTFAPMEASIGAYEREISVASEVYLLVLNKLNVAQFAALNDNNSLKQAEIAQVPEKPESSKKVMILALSLGVTIILCLMVVIGMAYFDETFYNTLRFETTTGFHLISFLPELKVSELSIKKLFTSTELSQEEILFSRNIRKIRQEIESNSHNHQSILFTGTKLGEGKSLTIIALANAFSLAGKTVLIVDANFKNATLTQLLNGNKYLSPETEDKNLDLSTSKTSINNVDIIGCEVNNASPSEIFGKLLNQQDFNNLKNKYDYILIEGPSLQLWADSREISDMVDAVITIFAAHHSISVNDKEALNFIYSLEEKHLGSILNIVHTSEIPEFQSIKKQNKKSSNKNNSKINTNIKIE